MDWLERFEKYNELTVGEHEKVRNFYNNLTLDEVVALDLLCNEMYKIGRFTHPQTDMIIIPDPDLDLKFLSAIDANSIDKPISNQTARERLHKIAEMCQDWDGARSSFTLGELVNEIWAYAVYSVKEN